MDEYQSSAALYRRRRAVQRPRLFPLDRDRMPKIKSIYGIYMEFANQLLAGFFVGDRTNLDLAARLRQDVHVKQGLG
jgi:hypothetical protein